MNDNNYELYNPILEEIYRMREEHAKKFNNDVRAMALDSAARGRKILEQWEQEKTQTTQSIPTPK